MARELPEYERVATELAARRHGVVARWQLRSAGIAARDVTRLVCSPHWRSATDHVLVRTGSTRTEEQRTAAVVLDAGPGWVLSHLSAARWWGAMGCPLEPFHLTGTGGTRRPVVGAVRHQVRCLPHAWTCELRAVPVARPELCALQLFAVCSARRAERLVDSMWSRRLCSGPSVARFVDDMGRRGRNGTAGLRRYLAERGPSYVPPASGVEGRAIEILAAAGISVRRQVDVGSHEQWTGRVDLIVDDVPVVVEIQSQRHHAALCDRQADLQRRQRLEAEGFVWVELWDDVVWSRPAEVIALVLDGVRRAQHPDR